MQVAQRNQRQRSRAQGNEPGGPRIVIETVRPEINAGRYPIKRLIGDVVKVQAVAYREGHDLIAMRLCYRGPGDTAFRRAPMQYSYDDDVWSGTFTLDRIGRWSYTVEGCPDPFGSWQGDLVKRVDAGQDVAAEFIEGALIVEEAAGRARGAARRLLHEHASLLRNDQLPHEQRLAVAMSETLHAAVLEQVDSSQMTRYRFELPLVADRVLAGRGAWYEMFPRSHAAAPGRHGTLAEAQQRLPRLAELGFDVVYLPPIHPIGRTNRKGRNNTLPAGPDDPGSPWAIGGPEGGHIAIDPRLGTHEDFRRFVQAARALNMEVALDYALQCSPDHPWLTEHPGWFFVRHDGTLRYAENPPKKYQDIYPLNFWCDDYPALWRACREIVEFWINEGVLIFRVDNPHTKPMAFWEWLISGIQRDHPEVIFLSEAFTRPNRMKGLAKLGFTQSYTYFTWRNHASELREYLTELTATDMVEYFRPNFFTNTPDILTAYLQTGGRAAFQVRLVLAATLAPVYGIYSGFELAENQPLHPGSEEYLNSEKYEVRHRDYDAPGNLNADIQRINTIRRENPALGLLSNLAFHASENDTILFYHKWAPGNDLLIAVNTDPHRPQETMVHVPLSALGIAPETVFEVEDLLSGEVYHWRGVGNYVRLDPARQVAHVLRVRRPGA